MDRLLLYDYNSSKYCRRKFCLFMTSFNFYLAKKGKGLSSLIIQQLGRGNRKDKRQKGNNGEAVFSQVPKVERVNRENEQIASFLNGGTF